jgi:hypothetical protein
MSGNLGDIGSIPESLANEMVEEVLRLHHWGPNPVSLDECRCLVEEVDYMTPNDLSDGEIEGLANLLFNKVMAK